MKKAMVLGASGGMGQAIVKELVNREIEVVAFARNEVKLQTIFGNDDRVILCPGDAQNKDELQKELHDIDVIFHALNVPYSQWEQKLEKIMTNVVELAKEKNIKLAIVDNIYAYGEGNGKKISEDYPKQPHTKKGKIRLRLEEIVKNSGVSALFAHFPDFYGPGAEKSMLHYFFASVRQDKAAIFIGNQKVKREYIYTPDGSKAIITLAQHSDAYGQHWNIPATDVISGKEIIELVRESERFTKKVFTVKKGVLRQMLG